MNSCDSVQGMSVGLWAQWKGSILPLHHRDVLCEALLCSSMQGNFGVRPDQRICEKTEWWSVLPLEYKCSSYRAYLGIETVVLVVLCCHPLAWGKISSYWLPRVRLVMHAVCSGQDAPFPAPIINLNRNIEIRCWEMKRKFTNSKFLTQQPNCTI